MEYFNNVNWVLFFRLLTVCIAGYMLWFHLVQRKRNVLFHMHQMWCSEYFRKCRLESFEEITKRATPENKIKISTLREKHPEAYRSLGTVEHFFSDINHLLKSRAIDKALTQQLFYSTVARFEEEVCGSINYDILREKEYFEENVKPLFKRLSKSKLFP